MNTHKRFPFVLVALRYNNYIVHTVFGLWHFLIVVVVAAASDKCSSESRNKIARFHETVEYGFWAVVGLVTRKTCIPYYEQIEIVCWQSAMEYVRQRGTATLIIIHIILIIFKRCVCVCVRMSLCAQLTRNANQLNKHCLPRMGRWFLFRQISMQSACVFDISLYVHIYAYSVEILLQF